MNKILLSLGISVGFLALSARVVGTFPTEDFQLASDRLFLTALFFLVLVIAIREGK